MPGPAPAEGPARAWSGRQFVLNLLTGPEPLNTNHYCKHKNNKQPAPIEAMPRPSPPPTLQTGQKQPRGQNEAPRVDDEESLGTGVEKARE